VSTWILGISALYHDAAAVLLCDGVVVAAAQEERFTRVKHDASLPVRAVSWCLHQASIERGDLDWLVFYEKPLRKFERIVATDVATFPRSWRSFPRHMHSWLGDKLWIRGRLVDTFGVPTERILFCEHHLSHAASAFLASPHRQAAVLVADGVGEWATTSLWRGSDQAPFLEPVAEVRWPHSLGLLYSAITAHLGFAVNEGEYKVMGMAAYGEPRMREQIDRIAHLEADGSFSLDMDYFCWHWHPTRSATPKLAALLGPQRLPGTPFAPRARPGDASAAVIAESQRHADLAASVQSWLEDAMLHLAGHAARTIGTDTLCLAGGVALNAVANHRLAAEGPFAHLWIQPAAGDAGGALGAALWAWHAVLGNPRNDLPFRVDLGPQQDRGHTVEILDDLGFRYEVLEEAATDRAVEDLVAGHVLGWVQGRAEWGPRALGHRSILADPRGADTAERVNRRIKLREPFRPFAPSVTAAGAAGFKLAPAAAAPARHMLVAAPVQAALAAQIPAVIHVDGSARVQVVDPDAHPAYHALLERFGQATGLPILLDTSFNLKGEPIVGSVVDALATFARSGLDVLYLDGIRVQRPPAYIDTQPKASS